MTPTIKSLASMESKLDTLLSSIERVEKQVLIIDERQRQSEIASARLEPQINQLSKRAEEAHKRLDMHESLIDKLTDSIHKLEWPVKVLLGIGGLLGASVIGLIWMVLTHQVVLMYP